VSVGDLFAGALVPGLLLVALYMLYLIAVAKFSPDQVPAQRESKDVDVTKGDVLRALVPPLLLIISVLGAILGGIATPTEAASVGAIGAIFLGVARLNIRWRWVALGCGFGLLILLIMARMMDLRVMRDHIDVSDLVAIVLAVIIFIAIISGLAMSLLALMRAAILRPVVETTTRITTMIFVILIGASIFSLVFRGFGGDDTIREALSDLPGGTFGALLAVLTLMFLLGFFLDFLEITFVVVPLVAPVLLQMPMADGSLMSPVWLGILMAVILQTSFLTPPFGVALFYLRGVAPPEIRTIDIYLGIVPFVAIQLFTLVILWVFPSLATWLPSLFYNG
jgi:TRAP-type mannitol/chloroaromatic compound transport system permease large subunit